MLLAECDDELVLKKVLCLELFLFRRELFGTDWCISGDRDSKLPVEIDEWLSD